MMRPGHYVSHPTQLCFPGMHRIPTNHPSCRVLHSWNASHPPNVHFWNCGCRYDTCCVSTIIAVDPEQDSIVAIHLLRTTAVLYFRSRVQWSLGLGLLDNPKCDPTLMYCTRCQLCRTLIYHCISHNVLILCHREPALDTTVSRLAERDGDRRQQYATGNTSGCPKFNYGNGFIDLAKYCPVFAGAHFFIQLSQGIR
jgi:hypothetical protein